MMEGEEQQQDICRPTSMLIGEDEGGRPSTAGTVDGVPSSSSLDASPGMTEGIPANRIPAVPARRIPEALTPKPMVSTSNIPIKLF